MSGGQGSSMDFQDEFKFLIVDGDIAHLESLWDAVHDLGCHATMCNTLGRALALLSRPNHGFDVVLADISVPCEIGFKFLKIVRNEMKLQIITMSSANDGRLIAAGTSHGSSECALKPVQKSDLQRFWRQAIEHRRRHLAGISNSRSSSEGHNSQNRGADQMITEESMYKSRLVWTKELHDRFVAAVNELGGEDKAIPSKIEERMGVPDVTREKIASHLQKYRMSLHKDKPAGKKKRRSSQASMSDTEKVNEIYEQASGIARGKGQVLSSEAPKLYFPEMPTDTLMMQRTTMPEFVADNRGHSLELQNPADCNQSETPSSIDDALKKFMETNLVIPAITYESYPFIQGNVGVNIPMAMHYSHGTQEEPQWPGFEPSPFGQGPSNGYDGV